MPQGADHWTHGRYMVLLSQLFVFISRTKQAISPVWTYLFHMFVEKKLFSASPAKQIVLTEIAPDPRARVSNGPPLNMADIHIALINN